jgi:predicted cation transporter
VIEIGLISAIILVLILPLTLHVIEKNLEIFLFIMGVLVVSISHFWGIEPAWSMHLIRESLVEPIMITLAVITIGFLVYFFRNKITNTVVNIERKIGSKLFCFV